MLGLIQCPCLLPRSSHLGLAVAVSKFKLGRCSFRFSAAAESAETAHIQEESAANKELKKRGSTQLLRWARARRKSARRLELRFNEETGTADSGQTTDESEDEADFDKDGLDKPGKAVFLVSDGTGWTVSHSVQAALGQFEHCLVDRNCSVSTHLFSEVSEIDKLMEIVRQAGEESAMLIYTLADPAMADAAKKACQMMAVPYLDILGPITEVLSGHIGVTPLGLPRNAPGRKRVLSREYFKRIEAVDFTIKHDDGALPKNLYKADIILTGVSRTSKTPLSTYLAQMGYKVANVPLVLGIEPPKELFEVSQDKIYGLTIDPNFLKSIRTSRYLHLGLARDSRSSYFDMDYIKKELEYSGDLFKKNPTWPVIEVTGKAIEETAAVILRIFHERKTKHVMPRISKRY